MATLRLSAKAAPPAPPAPDPPPASTVAVRPERTPEEKAERARAQAERERREQMEAKQRHVRRFRTDLAGLRQRWPDLFTTPLPLAVGVKSQIRAAMPELPSARLGDALHYWTHSNAYLMAVAARVERRNLDGTPAGVPDEEQRALAVEDLRKRRKWPAEEESKAMEVTEGDRQPEGNPA